MRAFKSSPTATPSNSTVQHSAPKPPFYVPSPSNVQRVRSPIEFSKPGAGASFSPNHYYSMSNSKNSSGKEKKVEKSQSESTKETELIQGLEERLNKALQDNMDLTQSLNAKSKDLEDGKTSMFGLKAKIRELEGVLGLFSSEKQGFDAMLKEKDEEIDELKAIIRDLKEKLMRISYCELQLENYKEVIEELQRLNFTRTNEANDLKVREARLSDLLSATFPFLAEVQTFELRLDTLIEAHQAAEQRSLELTETVKLIDSQAFPFLSKADPLPSKVSRLIEKLKEKGPRQEDPKVKEAKEAQRSMLESQVRQLREIDRRNKQEIEKLFGLLNQRKGELERLSEENKQIKDKYNCSLQKIKNLEHFFSQNFATNP